MHVCFTDASTGLIGTIESSLIMLCRRDPKSKLTTHMVTGVMGQGGLQAINIRETPMEMARRCNAATAFVTIKGEPPAEAVLGFENN